MTRKPETHCDGTQVAETVARLRDAGYQALDDYDGACCHKSTGTDHHHDHFVTIRRLPLRDAERLLGRKRTRNGEPV